MACLDKNRIYLHGNFLNMMVYQPIQYFSYNTNNRAIKTINSDQLPNSHSLSVQAGLFLAEVYCALLQRNL